MIRWLPPVFLDVVLPFCLFFAFILRPSLLSAFYGILLLIWPFVPGIKGNVPDFTKRYLLVSVVVTSFGLLAQCLFGILFASSAFSEEQLGDCGELASVLRVIGIQRLNIPHVGHALRLILPDIAACVSSVATFLVFLVYDRTRARLPSESNGQPQQLQLPVQQQRSLTIPKDSRSIPSTGLPSPVRERAETINNNDNVQQPNISKLLVVCLARLSEVVVVVQLCAAGIILPSIFSSIYFLSFLFIMTWWSLYKPMSVIMFNFIKLLLVAYSAFHLMVLYLYQTTEFQAALPPDSLSARLLGLTVLANTTCSEFWSLRVTGGQPWSVFANPLVVFAFYIYTALQTASTYRAGFLAVRERWQAMTTFIQPSPTGDRRSLRDEVAVQGIEMADRQSLLANETEEECGESRSANSTCKQPRQIVATPNASNLSNGDANCRIHSNRDYTRLFSIGTVPVEQTENKALGAAIAYVVCHSYALALVMMMAWAITYHSWLSFVWLALACVIWMMADSRRACYLLSPFIVIYAEILLCLQFIYGLNLKQMELSDDKDTTGVPMQQIGLTKPAGAACIPLFAKAFFSIPFWITLRLYMRERHYQRQFGPVDVSTPSGHHVFESLWPLHDTGLAGFISAKYWIYVVGLVLLLISIRTPVVAYEVCYMTFFVVLITVLQISFTLWRLMLFFYWTLLTAFSIGVLLLVYTYQFNEVPTWWHNWTKWSDHTFDDLGLVNYYPGSLFVQLLTPISFLIVVILQMKFFHTSFMQLTDFSKRNRKRKTETTVSTSDSKWFKVAKHYHAIICDFLWRLAEIHFTKLVAFAMIILAVSEICAVNFLFSVIVCCMLPCRRLNTVLSVIATIWAALVVISKMIYQMNFVDAKADVFYRKNCTALTNIGHPATWAGFERLQPQDTLGHYIKGYVIVLILLTFQAIIKLRQKYCREVLGKSMPTRGVLFPDIGRQDADENFTKCLMFLANYGFYKFGLELTYIMVIINVGIRMDGVAFAYTIWTLIMLALPRRTLARIWWLFVAFAAVSIPIQYAVCVGLPPSACMQYPWAGFGSKLTYWLYLPNYEAKPNQYFMIGDFFVLLMASAQLYVFRVESSPAASSPSEGGDNSPIWHYNKMQRMDPADGEVGRQNSEISLENPTPNFITHTRSYLDAAKVFIFVHFQWLTLFVMFAAGVGGISGFALGYMITAFALLWKGNDLYLETHSRIMIRWYVVLFYNLFVILLKICLQVVGCVYVCSVCDSSAWVVQLFSIACLRGYEDKCVGQPLHQAKCLVSKSEAEILYDGICFGFLVFQIRIFSSWYFRHSIAEFRAERLLSARGAYLINQLIRKEMHEQNEKEDRILRRLKAKTNRIRRHYLKQMVGKKHFEPNTYAETKRGGDYYMFDYDSDDEGEAEELEEKEPVAPETAHPSEQLGLGPAQLLHIVAGQKNFDLNEIVTEAEKRDAAIKRELSTGPSTSASIEPIRSPEVRFSINPIEEIHESYMEPDTATVERRGSGNFVINAFKFLALLFGSILNSLAITFNRWSRDYRYVAFVLKGEKRRLKETLMKQLEYESDFRRVRETVFNQEVSKKIHYIHSVRDIETAEREAQESALEHNVVVRFLIALYYLFVSHTELLCYLMIVLDHMGNAAIISLPLPFLAFFWGTLCSPRPPKFFWVTVITYTEAMIVVKFMFQFGFWNFEKGQELSPFNIPKILGIEQNDYYAVYDVILLMCLFFHRYVLKTLGLWKDALNQTDVNEMDAEVLLMKSDLPTTAQQDEEDDEKELQESSMDPDAESIVDDGTLDVVEGLSAMARRKSADMQGRLAYCSSFVLFYRRLLNPPFRYVMDLYSFMFLCDLVCFVILAFGYASFAVVRGKKYDVLMEIQQNKVPLPYLTMLISLMFLIIVDRAIYLSKSVLWKLFLQYLLVIVVHGWIFFGLPAMTDWPINRNGPAQLWYFVKCIYFLLSAWQIRNSYPSRIQGNLLARKFGLTNYCLFTGFMAAPFLFELRTLIDWIWTETSMPLFDYFTMENIYARVFTSKCMRQYETEYPVPRGEAKPKWIKYGLGLPVLVLIVALLWLPLILFALLNAIGNRVPPEQAQFSVNIEGYAPLYVMEAQKVYLHPINDPKWEALFDLCRTNKQGIAFLRQYYEKDIYVAHFRNNSISEWTISPAGRHALLMELKNGTSDLVVNFNWQFRRPSQSMKQLPQIHTSYSSVSLERGDTEDDRIRQEFIDTIEGKNRNGVFIQKAFPQFLVVPSIGPVQPAKAVLDTSVSGNVDEPETAYAGVRLFLDTLRPDYPDASAVQYWLMKMVVPSWMSSYVSQEQVEVTVFVDRVFPAYLDTFTSGGIIGVYVVVVLAAGRFIRTLVVQSPLDVILNEMPNVDRVLQLCLDVFLVREAGDFLLEQDLFAKLIFLFRSPETLVRWTRPKVE